VSRRFTLTDAEALLPQMDRFLRQAVAQKSEYQSQELELERINQKVTLTGGIIIDREAVLRHRQRRDRAAAALQEALAGIQDQGVLVKDLDIGLIDFPTLYQGREVYLCWRMGEPGIRYWHGEEGFRGRKEIDQEFVDHHEGD
jgi:hypothetical protein